MTITLRFQLKTKSILPNAGENTIVKFSKVPYPMTSDDLVDYFLRFGEACGFAKDSLLNSMFATAYENLPKKDLD